MLQRPLVAIGVKLKLLETFFKIIFEKQFWQLIKEKLNEE